MVRVSAVHYNTVAEIDRVVDALDTLINGGDRTIRVYGPMEQRPGELELVETGSNGTVFEVRLPISKPR